MELLLQAIEEKLANVDAERKKWQLYKDEHINAEKNLRDFEKSYRKDIMVPIGAKALMPGTLYHTNEVFVAMYSGLFVKCSADKALLVCQHRLKQADKRLELLDVEYKMYKDRLELPSTEHAFGGRDSGQEIIEEYDEQKELEWREQHRVRLRENKTKEAVERQQIQNNNSDKDIWALLDQAEMMEELENELQQLEVNDDSELMKHLYEMNMNPGNGDGDSGESGNVRNVPTNEVDADEIGTKQFNMLRMEAEKLSDADKIQFYEKHLEELSEQLAKKNGNDMNELAEMRITGGCLQEAIAEIREEMDDSDDESDHMDTQSSNDSLNVATETSNKPTNTDAPKAQIVKKSPECRKYASCADYEQVEREYERMEKSKSELLIFYKSQLRSVMKSIAGASSDLLARDRKRAMYEFITNRIDQLRIDIHIEKQKKAEEDFVDDDDDMDHHRPSNGRLFNLNLNRPNCRFNDDEDNDDDENNDDDCEEDSKRRIKFAIEPVITTFHEDDEPWRVQIESNRESFSDFIDDKFQFFASPTVEGFDDYTNELYFNDIPYVTEEAHDVPTTNEDAKQFYGGQNGNATNGSFKRTLSTSTDESSEQSPSISSSTSSTASPPTASPPRTSSPPPLIVEFEHSTNVRLNRPSTEKGFIDSPLDIYAQFGVASGQHDDADITASDDNIKHPTSMETMQNETSHMIFTKTNNMCEDVNMNTGSKERTIDINVNDRRAYNDNESVAQLPAVAAASVEPIIPNADVKPVKSILKNRAAVQEEIHQSLSDDDDEDEDEPEEAFYTQPREDPFGGFMQVLGEIRERSSPDEVVEQDANQQHNASVQNTSENTGSTKRVSLFKLNRMR